MLNFKGINFCLPNATKYILSPKWLKLQYIYIDIYIYRYIYRYIYIDIYIPICSIRETFVVINCSIRETFSLGRQFRVSLMTCRIFFVFYLIFWNIFHKPCVKLLNMCQMHVNTNKKKDILCFFFTSKVLIYIFAND